jgi:predicted signal transduction protein with EAL and GGDEF domain
MSPADLNALGAGAVLTACAVSLAWWWRARRFDTHAEQAMALTRNPTNGARNEKPHE